MAQSLNHMRAPLIIGHRGASGYLPEHTLAAYRLAIDLGADYIEPDLVFTKDGHLVARHDHYLSTTTNVADHPEFAGRRKQLDGRGEPDWFTEDFTLQELKTLRARQAFPARSHEMDNLLDIPTFAEVIALAQAESLRLGRAIGVYPETKLPSYFEGLGYDFEAKLLTALDVAGWSDEDAPVFIQSFEARILERLRQKTGLKLIRLLETMDGATLEEIAGYADGVGPSKAMLIGKDGKSTGLVGAAHRHGLKVHPWTFRSDQLPAGVKSAAAEYDMFFRLGVDAVFSDFPDAAREARRRFWTGG